MTHLLDTNVVSELRKRRGVADARVLEWAQRQHVDELFLSVVTVLEIEIGIGRVERRDAAPGRLLRSWLEDRVLIGFSGRTLPVTLDVARRAALLHVPDPRPERNAYVAATALVHGLTVATRNVADFEGSGVGLVNPWES